MRDDNMTCTFFGHRSVPKEIEPILRSTLINLIENHNVKFFYVGNHGGFDGMVYRTLKDLAQTYPITYHVVLAYIPSQKSVNNMYDDDETILPDNIEAVPKRFAIIFRNKWMIRQSDYVITYVTERIASGAAQFKELAERQGKNIINLYIK